METRHCVSYKKIEVFILAKHPIEFLEEKQTILYDIFLI